jgi:hypothetical protein
VYDEDWLERRARHSATEERLTAELDRARERIRMAKVEFNAKVSSAREIGLDNPDGANHAYQASKQYNKIADAYRLALKRYSNFILRGEMPSDDGPPEGS